mmetsp:Transcript_9271/g.23048  ORF Transcript_9271/g.23048 Transcript_9271/m.23048 type:complete len:311 (-) Transcript_9271:114-1046(-)
MTIRTMKCSCTFLVLLLSTSVFARQYSAAFVPKRASVVSSLSSDLPPFSALYTTAFSEERDAQILAAHVSNFVVAATLCRGGGYDNYYDDRGYGGNDDDYYNDGNQGYEDNYYDDRGPSDKGRGFGPSSFSMPDVIKRGNRKIGLPLLGIGGALTILGASLFFNKTLMRLGNLFFVVGVPMTLGPGRTMGYFLQPKKARATGCLIAGITLVFIGWPIFGIILEVFGLLNLFGNMFPMAMMIIKQMPVIGPLLKGNAGKKNESNNDRGYGGGRDRYDDDDRYDDRYGGDDSYYNDYNDRGYPDDDDRNRYY